MNETILVTGGTGYIGSHTVEGLIEKNYDVVIIDNLSNSNSEVIDHIEQITSKRPAFEKLDLCDSKNLELFFRKYSAIRSIIHFAALKAVGESVEKPLEYYRNNLVSMMNLMEMMKKFNIPDLVFSSSCTVYGQPDQLPVKESSPLLPPTSPYGNTKKICEDIMRDTVGGGTNVNAISLRYFNPVGAHPSALIGELPVGIPLNLVPYLTQTASGVREELRIFGNDYDTPDGTGIRDYIYVVDLAKAHVKAIQRLHDKKNKNPYEIFNLGTGSGVSVLDIIHTFEKATGIKLKYRIYPRRSGDIACIYADASFANRELGWKALTPLSDIMLSAWNWEKKLRKIK